MKSDSEFHIEALRILCPNGAGWDGVEIKTISDPIPTQKEMDAKIAELKAEYDAQEYARNRASDYPSIGDQLDMLMKDMRDGTTTHQESCEAVKDKYPKPT